MAEEGANEALRLEAALDRIALAAARVKAPVPAVAPALAAWPGEAAVDVPALAARLDALIEELRGILGQA